MLMQQQQAGAGGGHGGGYPGTRTQVAKFSTRVLQPGPLLLEYSC
jgi:hypothetical protein